MDHLIAREGQLPAARRRPDEPVVVGGCHGLFLLSRDQLPSYLRGYFYGGAACAVILVLQLLAAALLS